MHYVVIVIFFIAHLVLYNSIMYCKLTLGLVFTYNYKDFTMAEYKNSSYLQQLNQDSLSIVRMVVSATRTATVQSLSSEGRAHA